MNDSLADILDIIVDGGTVVYVASARKWGGLPEMWFHDLRHSRATADRMDEALGL